MCLISIPHNYGLILLQQIKSIGTRLFRRQDDLVRKVWALGWSGDFPGHKN